MKLAEALLLRKQLAQKVDQLKPLKIQGDQGIFETKIDRVKISDTIDEAKIKISRITLDDVTSEFNKYATALRKCDAAIQQANWQFDVDIAAPEGMQ